MYTHYLSPLGMLLLCSDGQALTGLWLSGNTADTTGMERRDDLALFASVTGWLDDYFAGKPREVDFPLDPEGTAFQKRVWSLLQSIPYGATTTYGAIAKVISPQMSAQAVGQAVGKNPIGIVIPCHRVVGAKGQLTGYAGGIEKKKWLLRHEEERK